MAKYFFNISNHPSVNWNETQKASALLLASEIKDIAFPNVPPLHSTSQIFEIAHDIVAQIKKEVGAEQCVAMVQGEATLVFITVLLLQQQGVHCYAATTERVVAENADGSKTSTYAFCQFREYQHLSMELLAAL